MSALKPLPFVLVGIAIIFGGFVYHVNFGGIPYQDPTPEMQAAWLFHSRIGDTTILVGLAVFLFGVLWGAVRWIRKPRAH